MLVARIQMRYRNIRHFPLMHARLRFLAAFAILATSLQLSAHDLVLNNGRVMDPATGLDAVRHVGITGGKITAISETPLTGRETLDAGGLVVSPGFIDIPAAAAG